MLSKSPTKSCELDPAPTWYRLLKQFAAEITSAQTQLINLSLETGMVPKNFKQALVRPLLKGNNLNTEDVNTYRPVSNLSFMSKQLERVITTHLFEHLSENNLCEALQLALCLTTAPKQPFSMWATISQGFPYSTSACWIQHALISTQHAFICPTCFLLRPDTHKKFEFLEPWRFPL